MSLITRQGKGEKLTIQEMDGNLEYLEGLSQDIESSVSALALDLQDAVPYKAYRAKLTAQTVDWPGYGYLYNWYAVDDSRNISNPAGGTGLIAPNEWRVPSDGDWNTLVTFAGGSSVTGGKLKSTLTSTGYPFNGWLFNSAGTDDYNFGGLPGGIRVTTGQFSSIGNDAFFWTSTSVSTSNANLIRLLLTSGTIVDNYIKSWGISVRLVREATAGELLLADGDTSDTSSLDSYTGNDGTEYVTVKIGTQVWLAQNLRETKYNDNSDIFNASILFGGDFGNSAWQAKGIAQEGALAVYVYTDSQNSSAVVPYLPDTIERIYTDILENTLGQQVGWESGLDGTNVLYQAYLQPNRLWYPTHIKLTPGYDVSGYDNSVPSIVQKNLIVKKAVAGENSIDFFPVKIDGNGTLTIEPLANYSELVGSPDSSVYVEILEYQPESYYNSYGGGLGIGVNNL